MNYCSDRCTNVRCVKSIYDAQTQHTLPLTKTQYPSTLRGAHGGCGRTPFTATTMTVRSPGCASNFLFVAAVAASKAVSARPFLSRRGLGTSSPPVELKLVLLVVLEIFEELVGLGCLGDTATTTEAAAAAAPRGPVLSAGTSAPSLRSSATPRRPERAGEGDGEEGLRLVFVCTRPIEPAIWPGDVGKVAMPGEAPALDVRGDASCGDGGRDGGGDLALFRGGVAVPEAPEGMLAGGGAYRTELRGHFMIDPGTTAQPWMSRSQGGVRSRLQVEQAFLERECDEQERAGIRSQSAVQ